LLQGCCGCFRSCTPRLACCMTHFSCSTNKPQPDAPSCLVLGTEDGRVLILNVAGEKFSVELVVRRTLQLQHWHHNQRTRNPPNRITRTVFRHHCAAHRAAGGRPLFHCRHRHPRRRRRPHVCHDARRAAAPGQTGGRRGRSVSPAGVAASGAGESGLVCGGDRGMLGGWMVCLRDSPRSLAPPPNQQRSASVTPRWSA
jgi:hypothetical protein